MHKAPAPEQIVERLRSNLRAAGIRFTEADLQGIFEQGFLRNVAAFEAALEHTPVDRVPDYLDRPEDAAAPDVPVRAAHPAPVEPPPAPGAGDDRHDATIGTIAERLRRREVSPVELTEQALARIAERDPILNAFQLVLAESARAAARRAEREIAAGTYRGPLHGVPIAVKDLLAMAGTPTTAGSKILAGWVTDFDAAAVERLVSAGAVIVGKTRLSEFAYSPGSNNPHYGPTHNPHNLERDTGGSSSGSAAAVADGMVYGALGTDTGGSIRIPASLCGIVGLKPTYGRISLHGVVPLAWSLDHLGPMTRSVADAALLLAALAGPDPRDPRTQRAPAPGPGWLDRIDRGVAGLRIGVLRDDGSGGVPGTPAALDAWHAGLAVLEHGGAELVEIAVPELADLRALNNAILAAEAAAYHEPMLRARPDDFGPFVYRRLLTSYAYGPGAFVRAQQARAALRQRCAAIFERVDLLSTPSQPDAAPPLGIPAWTTFTAPFNILGWPAISVPAGATADGLPLGLQLVGRPWSEATLLRAAWVIETGLAHAPRR